MAGTVKATCVVTVTRGKEHDAAQKIRKTKEAAEVLVTYGLYDIVVRIEAQSLGQLDKPVTDIRQMAEIQQTSSLIGAQ
ncbi:MAG: Lrp/AsnC ligand binding domain-containing protein [Candidatus Bathyarchaeia archaeon]|nr:Lrp/AsnC ligand binding domain-containing protein [Candidatus Bathyarchaeia archaeon]